MASTAVVEERGVELEQLPPPGSRAAKLAAAAADELDDDSPFAVCAPKGRRRHAAARPDD